MASSFLQRLGAKLRQYVVVNPKHVDAHDVYQASVFRRPNTQHYVPPQTPYDKVAGNQYFKRDQRRSYPQTFVLKNGEVAAGESVKAVEAGAAPNPATSSTASSWPPVPGKTQTLQYSEYASEYPTVVYYK